MLTVYDPNGNETLSYDKMVFSDLKIGDEVRVKIKELKDVVML